MRQLVWGGDRMMVYIIIAKFMVAKFMLACLWEVGLIGSSAHRVSSIVCETMTRDGCW